MLLPAPIRYKEFDCINRKIWFLLEKVELKTGFVSKMEMGNFFINKKVDEIKQCMVLWFALVISGAVKFKRCLNGTMA